MGASGYSHSPYFRSKQAAKRALYLSDREIKAARDRVKKIGKVELSWTKELIDIRNTSRRWDTCSMKDFANGFVCGYNLPIMGVAIAVDIGTAMIRDMRAIADPDVREVLKSELKRNLRIVRRPWYYARETARRRLLAAERRKLHRRTTANPCPTAEGLLAAWDARKSSKEAMIILGGMLQDLECYVDSTLRFDESGNVIGRNGGIRGWLKENLPDLVPKYKTLMRYKAMAIRLRQATRTQDPLPTDDILKEPRSETAREILSAEGDSFESLWRAIERHIDADLVLRDPVRKKRRSRRRR